MTEERPSAAEGDLRVVRGFHHGGSANRRSMPTARLFIFALSLVTLIALGGCRTALVDEVHPEQMSEGLDEGPELGRGWREVWLSLGRTENRCRSFDYHPQGGMRMFYCHLLSVVDWPPLQALSGAPPIFLSGPHQDGKIDLGPCHARSPCAKTFGHYNPAFVRWAGVTLNPGAHDGEFRKRTQALYQRYVRGLARTFWASHLKLEASPSCMRRELAAYRAAMDAGDADYYERWFDYLRGDFCSAIGERIGYEHHSSEAEGLLDGNVVKSTVGFWLRRHIDGTQPLFVEALERLLRTYDTAWLSSFRLPNSE